MNKGNFNVFYKRYVTDPSRKALLLISEFNWTWNVRLRCAKPSFSRANCGRLIQWFLTCYMQRNGQAGRQAYVTKLIRTYLFASFHCHRAIMS